MPTVEVLLQEDVENLGRRGQVVRVRAGYARNYLIPRKLAVPATASNLKWIEQQSQILARRETRERRFAETLAEKIQAVELVLPRRVGEHDMLFGAVTALDIADALADRGLAVDRRKILLEQPIKYLGEYQVPIKLHRDVTVTVKLTVVSEDATS
jgi:large subunit ribosomal protein L9